jgi:hypothetical protein
MIFGEAFIEPIDNEQDYFGSILYRTVGMRSSCLNSEAIFSVGLGCFFMRLSTRVYPLHYYFPPVNDFEYDASQARHPTFTFHKPVGKQMRATHLSDVELASTVPPLFDVVGFHSL